MSTVDGHVYERVAIRQWLLEHDALSIEKRPPGGFGHFAPPARPASARSSPGRPPARASPGQPRSAPVTWQAPSGCSAIPALFPTYRHDSSPKTGEALEAKILIPCHVLRGMIIRYQEDRAAEAAAAAAAAAAAVAAAASSAATAAQGLPAVGRAAGGRSGGRGGRGAGGRGEGR